MDTKVKGWLGYVLVFWPIVKFAALYFHIPLPDLAGLGDVISSAAPVVGGTMLARSAPIMGPKKDA